MTLYHPGIQYFLNLKCCEQINTVLKVAVHVFFLIYVFFMHYLLEVDSISFLIFIALFIARVRPHRMQTKQTAKANGDHRTEKKKRKQVVPSIIYGRAFTEYEGRACSEASETRFIYSSAYIVAMATVTMVLYSRIQITRLDPQTKLF